jgi:hypothetical protein
MIGWNAARLEGLHVGKFLLAQPNDRQLVTAVEAMADA